MKITGVFLMPAGFFLVAAALVLFSDPARRGVFICCGLLVEVIGLGMAMRGHMPQRGAERA